MTEMTDPVDSLHRECLHARADVNEAFREAKAEAAEWEPRPIPPRRNGYNRGR